MTGARGQWEWEMERDLEEKQRGKGGKENYNKRE